MTEVTDRVEESRPRRFRPYPEYRDSGVEWLGELPAYWESFRLRFIVETGATKGDVRGLDPETEVSFIPMEAVGEYGGLDLDTTKPLSEVVDGYTYFGNGDVIVAKITPCFENGKGSLVSGLRNGLGFGTTELHVLRPSVQVDARFLLYLTFSDHFRRIGAASMYGAGGQKRISDDFIRNFHHPLPSLSEQCAVAAFLDRETAKIDALAASKERLIELLQEKRTALITRAVTRGLDPNVPMKDSGVEWLGAIPANWDPERVKRLFQHTKRQGFPEQTVLSVYREYGVIEKSSRDDNANRTPEDLEVYQLVNPGDLVINKMKAWQGSLGISSLSGITSPDYVVYEPEHGANEKFLHHLLRSKLLARVYLTLSNGIRPSQWRLEPERFEELVVFLPPRVEQDQIARFLDRETAKIDALIAKIREAIDHLKEFRTALLSAAVTGKIDIRTAADAATADQGETP